MSKVEFACVHCKQTSRFPWAEWDSLVSGLTQFVLVELFFSLMKESGRPLYRVTPHWPASVHGRNLLGMAVLSLSNQRVPKSVFWLFETTEDGILSASEGWCDKLAALARLRVPAVVASGSWRCR